ncbi:MAG: WD40/YVTN/BNR-like repeat-containing protein [Mariniblastus sp.]
MSENASRNRISIFAYSVFTHPIFAHSALIAICTLMQPAFVSGQAGTKKSEAKVSQAEQDPTEERLRVDGSDAFSIVTSPWKMVDIKTGASFRGLHVLSKTDIWAGGTNGTIANSIDGGKTWRVRVIQGAEELDFRDIHAIDDGTIVAMTSGTPARIYRSTTGGSSWRVCYQHTNPKVFLDSISFLDDQHGVAMGDPIDQKLFLLRTRDSGKTWRVFRKYPKTDPGEAGFAASGTNMTVVGQKVMVALGAAEEGQSSQTSRVMFSGDEGDTWKVSSVPIPRNPSAGIFSICFANEKDGVAVGGDYKQPELLTGNYAVTRNGGVSWSTPSPRVPPTGFRSCVAVWMNGREVNFVAVGPNGTDVSTDLGNKWHRISNKGFNSIDFTEDGRHGWAVGPDGKIAKWLGIPRSRPGQSLPVNRSRTQR